MNKEACKKLFYELVHPSLPNEWEVDQIFEEVAKLSEDRQYQLLNHIPAIWPISHSLTLSFLEDGCKIIDYVPAELIPKWVRTILRSYEQEGLKGARRYILQVQKYFLLPLEKQNSVSFEEIEKQMLFYLRGISGEDLFIEKAQLSSTDTTTYFLPQVISLLPNYDHNRFLYKFILSLHWGFSRWGTFKAHPHRKRVEEIEQIENGQNQISVFNQLDDCFADFENVELAADLFFLLETGRIMTHLRDELPGLTMRFEALKNDFVDVFRVSSQTAENRLGAALTELGFYSLFRDEFRPAWLGEIDPYHHTVCSSAQSEVSSVRALYDQLSSAQDSYQRPELLQLLGTHDFSRTAGELRRKRLKMKEDFIAQIRAFQNTIKKHNERSETSTTDISPQKVPQTVVAVGANDSDDKPESALTVLDNPDVEIPRELLDLIEKIKDDLGFIPQSYFSAASGIAGHGFSRESSVGALVREAPDVPGDIFYDEWDFRRSGYRKNWCTIRERQLPEVHSTFVAATLDKHRGVLMKLRRQFEMMKNSEHFIRRQREGDDLDLDAIVEARGDQRAGISPSGKWFIRLQRNERDIVTVFLIDMSNSTEGWVGGVIKEALVLLCEVMDVAGDPYEILGFSGMRRSRCDLYQVKNIDEPYSKIIRSRINAIVPREYTRMGPAVRYATRRLKKCEARTRLLVTITDGKPEDYDDYKGEYAIEDTRKALQEARGSGIHSFGITVDREAHEYLPRMFGAGNYIFIDDIEKLPMRMVDMYRLLTN